MYERWQVFSKRDGGLGPSVGIDPQEGIVLVGAQGEVQGGYGMGGVHFSFARYPLSTSASSLITN